MYARSPYARVPYARFVQPASGGGSTLTILKAAITLAGNAVTAAEALAIAKAGLVLAGNATNAAVALKPTKAGLTLSANATNAAAALRITKAALTLTGNAVSYAAATALTVLMGSLSLAGRGVKALSGGLDLLWPHLRGLVGGTVQGSVHGGTGREPSDQ